MNYPASVKKTYKHITNYGNRGMDLEELINMSCENYIEKDIAYIYKKPTPIQVVKYDYNKNRITDAYYKTHCVKCQVKFNLTTLYAFSHDGYLPINIKLFIQIEIIKTVICGKF